MDVPWLTPHQVYLIQGIENEMPGYFEWMRTNYMYRAHKLIHSEFVIGTFQYEPYDAPFPGRRDHLRGDYDGYLLYRNRDRTNVLPDANQVEKVKNVKESLTAELKSPYMQAHPDMKDYLRDVAVKLNHLNDPRVEKTLVREMRFRRELTPWQQDLQRALTPFDRTHHQGLLAGTNFSYLREWNKNYRNWLKSRLDFDNLAVWTPHQKEQFMSRYPFLRGDLTDWPSSRNQELAELEAFEGITEPVLGPITALEIVRGHIRGEGYGLPLNTKPGQENVHVYAYPEGDKDIRK